MRDTRYGTVKQNVQCAWRGANSGAIWTYSTFFSSLIIRFKRCYIKGLIFFGCIIPFPCGLLAKANYDLTPHKEG
jgi:hypothetical protein